MCCTGTASRVSITNPSLVLLEVARFRSRRRAGPCLRPPDHAALVDHATRGDATALDALIARHLPTLVGYIRLHADPVIRDHESCSDIAQSVCRDVLEETHSFEYRGEPAFRAWLCTKALTKLVNRKRYYLTAKRDVRRNQPLLAASDQDLPQLYAKVFSASDQAVARETAKHLEAAFDQLPEDYRRVITLSRVLGMSHAEIGTELGRDQGAVRVLLHRALVRLGRLMHEGRGPSA